MKIFQFINFSKSCRIILKQTQIKPSLYKSRNSSNYKRPLLNSLHKDQLCLKDNVLQSKVPLGNTKWNAIRKDLIDSYKHVNAHNVDAMILGQCNASEYLPIAKDYIEFLRSEGIQPNTATLGRLLKVYHHTYQANNDLSEECKSEIFTIYNYIRQKYDVLDGTTCENLILGLVATDRWQDAIEMLEMMKLSSTPTVTAYSAVITKAFRMGQLTLGWKLLKEMIENGKQPKCEIFITLLETYSRQEATFYVNMEKLFKFLSTHEVVITAAVANSMLDMLKKMNYTVASTSLNSFGKCRNCGEFMQNVSISDDEFQALSSSFLERVLVRKDVFQKSSPEELKKFILYVDKTGPYDCVIDGLNVAYSSGSKHSPRVFANLLSSVVQWFNAKNKHVLVLGRKHMNSWPKGIMNNVKKNASTFFTDNLTHDDPFLLYATLKSGQSTDFFSRDLMRSHSFLLGPGLKTIFRRWQQEHQYSLLAQTGTGKLIVKEPVRYLTHAQEVNSIWHIPYKQDYSANPSENFVVPESWLCIQLRK